VRWGDGEVLATLELPSQFAGDLDAMLLHPALLDKAIGSGRDFILGEVPYMPYSYGRLVLHRRFSRRLYVHTQVTSPESRRSETPTFNLVLMDEHGDELVRIDGFALKRVNDVGALYRSFAAAAEVAPAPFDEPDATTRPDVFAQLLQEAITPAEGAEAFARILAHGRLGQVVVSTRDLDALLERGLLPSAPAAKESEAAEAQPAQPLRTRQDLATPFAAPENEQQELIARVWRDVLSLDRVGVHDSFFDLGGDSVLAIQVVARLRKTTGRDVQVAQLFETPTVARLAELMGGAALGRAAP
jgi:aryl carrier-like protein